MKNLLAILIAIVIATFTMGANAQEFTLPDIKPVPGEVDVGTAISPMKKHQVAPFSGVLLSPKAVATIIAQLATNEALIKVETDRVKAEESARCTYSVNEVKTTLEADKRIVAAQLVERDRRINVLNDLVKEQQDNETNTPFWVGLGTGVGFAAGVGITVLTVFAVNQ